MKTTLTALSLILASMTATAMPSHNLDVSVHVNDGSATVKVFRDGTPIEGATVTANKFSAVTNDEGSTFYNLVSQRSQYVEFTVTDNEGNSQSVKRFITGER
ncbi:hypothetical protein A1OW_12655 [Enterovibrio norvegicus]|uniref:Nickel transport protein n=2 Tax=Enterovibrio norvegicus TaxID=188144 RepID=A0A1I5KZ05_9GAMM|nr:hypothetical protein [Enterovibrio norvegicus]OEF49485.1 hypothetical protein A1OW_12655 [Enterovibrio norvegicus]OEF56589.1 hypothetical protein A1OU_17690 [Enterovibrio norvegicus]SFO89846.1 hypothetical protein SAMN03084138_00797 [Enterovibrio norvegicus DSM 15893]